MTFEKKNISDLVTYMNTIFEITLLFIIFLLMIGHTPNPIY